MRRLRALATIGVLALAGIAPAVAAPSVACAATGPHAGLVIDTGARTIELCVTLDATSVTGLHLIELAAAQHGLSYGFGLGGQAVCRLDGVGPAGDDCFADYPRYWGYWHGNGNGGWAWASAGAGSARVADGGLDGWVWGEGDSGSTHAQPPHAGIEDVCPPPTPAPPTPAPTPTPQPTPSRAPAPPSPASTTQAVPAPSAEAGTPLPHDPAPGETPTRSSRTGAPPPSTSAPAALAMGPVPPSTPGDGPPAGMFAALVLGLALAAGGWLRSRSRSRGSPWRETLR